MKNFGDNTGAARSGYSLAVLISWLESMVGDMEEQKNSKHTEKQIEDVQEALELLNRVSEGGHS